MNTRQWIAHAKRQDKQRAENRVEGKVLVKHLRELSEAIKSISDERLLNILIGMDDFGSGSQTNRTITLSLVGITARYDAIKYPEKYG